VPPPESATPGRRIGRAPLAARDWARRRRSTHVVLQVVVAVVGFGLVAAGAVMLVLPGPGWAAILLGLVVLASEFELAARWRDALAHRLRDVVARVRRRPHAQ
jgi:uncharacterized protein (TIGR02611 family)